MKLLTVISLAFMLSGCGNVKRMWSGWTGTPVEYCHKGVMYLQFPSGATVAYNKQGQIGLCYED